MSAMDFVHLHVHSEYSFLDGMCRVKALAARAREQDMPAVALTDHGGLFGAVEFFKACRAEGVKPVLGCEVYVAPEGRFVKKPSAKGEAGYHLLLLAETDVGYRNLIKLSSQGYLEGFYYKPRVDKDLLAQHREGVVALSACIKGEVSQRLLAGDRPGAGRVLGEYLDIFGRDGFYIELQDHGLAEEHRANRGLLELAEKHVVPVVATNDVHYLDAAEARAHDVLLCIQTGRNLADPGRLRFGAEHFYFKSGEEMARIFAEVPAAIRNAGEIARRCDVSLDFGHYKLPRFEVPEGLTAGQYLRRLVTEGLAAKFPRKPPDVMARVEYELGVIGGMGMEPYYLIVWDLVRYAKSQGIMVGPGRGSAASSLVAYLLGITGVNPLDHGLIFERFLNPERISMPDFDIDFGDRRREEVVSYITAKYGRESVAQIITFGTLAARAAVKDVGRVLQIPFSEVDAICKEINPLAPLSESLSSSPVITKEYRDNPRVRECIDLALQIEGLTRHPSVHAAGVVVAPDDITNYAPLFRGKKGEVTTQFDMSAVETIGLLKIDVLGLKTLTVIEDCLLAVNRRRGIKIAIEDIPYDDPAAYDLICAGETDGVFQLESEGMRDLCRRVAPRSFKEIVPILALFRPGPMGAGSTEQYISGKHGRAPAKAAHPALAPILADNYGALLYQEDVLKIAAEIAGFSMGQADILRKAMGKKRVAEMAAQRAKFVEGAVARGYDRATAEEVFDTVAPFAEYGFNKAHATAYAVLSYQTAYLRANYPGEFMAALLSSEIGNPDKIVQYVGAARAAGITILPPDINKSWYKFWVEGDNLIRTGMEAIKNVGRAAIEEIVAARRRGGDFSDMVDFCARVDLRVINRAVLESLIKAGAFDSWGKGRAPLYEGLDASLEAGKRLSRDRSAGQTMLLDAWQEEEGARPAETPVKEWHPLEYFRYEKELLGVALSGHPLERYRDVLRKQGASRVGDVLAGKVTGQVKVGGMVGRIKTVGDKKGREMAFFTLEDEGSLEVVAFADCYEKSEFVIFPDRPVLVEGKVRADNGARKVIAQRVTSLEDVEFERAREVHVTLPPTADGELLNEIKNLLAKNRGECGVYFHVLRDGRELVIRAHPDFNCAPTRQFVKLMERLTGRGQVSLC